MFVRVVISKVFQFATNLLLIIVKINVKEKITTKNNDDLKLKKAKKILKIFIVSKITNNHPHHFDIGLLSSFRGYKNKLGTRVSFWFVFVFCFFVYLFSQF